MPRKHLVEYPNRIRFWRDVVGITQENLGKSVGVTKVQISRLELGKRDLVLNQARSIADALGVNTADLLPVQDNPCAADTCLKQIALDYKQSSDEGRHYIAAFAQAAAAYNGGSKA